MEPTGAIPDPRSATRPTSETLAELTLRFRQNAHSSLPRAPLNAALSTAIANDPDLVALLGHAPPEQHTPVLLLACLHDLVLRDPDCALAQWYRSIVDPPRPPEDPLLVRALGELVGARTGELLELLRTRRVQTNEVGRCSLYVLAISGLDAAFGPLAHLDVGSSAGLNLQFDRYHYVFDPGGTLGPPSPVVLEIGLRGDPPLPDRLPEIAARCGIDIAPLDVTDLDAARWLEACCWPDQIDRFRRLHAAIAIAREQPPELLAGDAATSIALAVERVSPRGHPVVTNSWVLNYLTEEQRSAYVGELHRVGATRDLTWIFVESPRQTPGLPWPTELDTPDQTHLMRATWRDGCRRVEHLARCHPHGYWAHWRNDNTQPSS